jgi:hypothetical protein
MIDRRD